MVFHNLCQRPLSCSTYRLQRDGPVPYQCYFLFEKSLINLPQSWIFHINYFRLTKSESGPFSEVRIALIGYALMTVLYMLHASSRIIQGKKKILYQFHSFGCLLLAMDGGWCCLASICHVFFVVFPRVIHYRYSMAVSAIWLLQYQTRVVQPWAWGLYKLYTARD